MGIDQQIPTSISLYALVIYGTDLINNELVGYK